MALTEYQAGFLDQMVGVDGTVVSSITDAPVSIPLKALLLKYAITQPRKKFNKSLDRLNHLLCSIDNSILNPFARFDIIKSLKTLNDMFFNKRVLVDNQLLRILNYFFGFGLDNEFRYSNLLTEQLRTDCQPLIKDHITAHLRALANQLGSQEQLSHDAAQLHLEFERVDLNSNPAWRVELRLTPDQLLPGQQLPVLQSFSIFNLITRVPGDRNRIQITEQTLNLLRASMQNIEDELLRNGNLCRFNASL